MVLGQTDMSRWIYKYMFTGTLQGCAFCPRACKQYFVYKINFNCPHRCVLRVHHIIIWGGGTRFRLWVSYWSTLITPPEDHPCTGCVHSSDLYPIDVFHHSFNCLCLLLLYLCIFMVASTEYIFY
jgi:hypothetical protein